MRTMLPELDVVEGMGVGQISILEIGRMKMLIRPSLEEVKFNRVGDEVLERWGRAIAQRS